MSIGERGFLNILASQGMSNGLQIPNIHETGCKVALPNKKNIQDYFQVEIASLFRSCRLEDH